MSAYVAACYYYPLKSGHTVETDRLEITARGPKNDRLWMLIDDEGQFISQRTPGFEKLALVRATIDGQNGNVLWFAAPGHGLVDVQYEPDYKCLLPVTVWGSDCAAYEPSRAASKWFSGYLGKSCRLVRYAETAPRAVDPLYARSGDTVSFADGFPLLVTAQASLAHLSAQFPGSGFSMDRFRPNIVLGGIAAFEEDVVHHLRIGDVELEFVKPCARCVMTTIDQQSGEKSPINEPLASLVSVRRGKGGGLQGAFFGQNAIPRALGTIEVGASAEILSRRPLHPALARNALRFDAA